MNTRSGWQPGFPMKDWEAKHGDISQFDASKVDVMSIHEQVALNVSSAESKYHKM